MKIETRIVFFINKLTNYLKRKNSFFKEVFSFALFTLFFGFLIGNLFGTFLNTLRSFIFWDGFIIFIILFIMEFLNFILYNKAKRFFFLSFFFLTKKKLRKQAREQSKAWFPFAQPWKEKNQKEKPKILYSSNNKVICKSFNYFKIGIMFGFFIDAFKVGS